MIVTTADQAVDIALTARHAMQTLRDSDLAGGRVWVAADRACRAIDDVAREAQRIAERKQSTMPCDVADEREAA